MHPSTSARRGRPLAVLLAALLALGVLAGAPAPAGAELPDRTDDDRPPRDIRQIEVLNVSHRGEVRGSTQPPENTLAAIAEAIRVGADAVEVDVTLSADDELVLMHDRTLNRTTDAVEVFGAGQHPTRDYTLEQLRTLSAGTFEGEVQRIPTFEEVLDLVRGRTALLIDVKYDHADTPIEPLIADALDAQPDFAEWGPDSVSFGSYGWTSLQAARTLLPDLELTFIMNFLCLTPDGVIVAGDLPPDRDEGIPDIQPGDTFEQFIDKLLDGGIGTVGIFRLSIFKGTPQSCQDNDFTPAHVQAFDEVGILFSQEAQTPADMQDRIDRGVRAILTDYPDTLAEVLPVPDAPTDVAAVAGNGSAVVSWTPPDPYQGSRRTGYVITPHPGAATVEVGPDATEATVTGLENGTEYTFTVQARNFGGLSEASEHTEPVTPEVGATADELYVGFLYETLLGRPADDAGRTYWVGRLGAGSSRAYVARQLALSPEAQRGVTVERMFQAWLDRPADPGGRAFWADRLVAGVPLATVEAGILSSSEFRANAGTDDEAWVRALYPTVLGREADDGGVAHYLGRLQAGQSRASVALLIRHSGEGVAAAVEDAYQRILDRSSVGDAGAESLRALQRQTRDLRWVDITLAASDEAYDQVTG